jgi:hypothetical protein
MGPRQNAPGGVGDRAVQSRAVNLRDALRYETYQQRGGKDKREWGEKKTKHAHFSLDNQFVLPVSNEEAILNPNSEGKSQGARLLDASVRENRERSLYMPASVTNAR